MDKEQLLDKLWELSINAGMNQRLHQEDWTRYATWDGRVKIAVAVLAAVAFGVAVFAGIKPQKRTENGQYWWDWGSMFAAFAAVLMAIILNVWSPEHYAMEHADLFRRWSDQRRDIDALADRIEASDEVSPYDLDRFRELLARKTDISAMEKFEDPERLKKEFQVEIKSRYRDGEQPESTPDPPKKEESPDKPAVALSN